MKKSLCLAASLLALNLMTVFGQPNQSNYVPAPAPALQPGVSFQQRLQAIQRPGSPQTEAPNLTQFNLDFPGGTPAELVKAVEKATGKPLNVIIPTENADIQLPPLKMNDVVTPQLFAALEAASRKTVAVATGNFGNSYSQFVSGYGFQTADNPISDTSIWYFHADKPSLPPVVSTEKICQFYPLLEYLNRGFTVDDITTAVQTGWKMAGETSPPELNYHKETKLLIAFGEPNKLITIRNVLDSLPAENAVQRRFDLDSMKMQINQLQTQVDKLTKNISTLTSSQSAQPEEKSGK